MDSIQKYCASCGNRDVKLNEHYCIRCGQRLDWLQNKPNRIGACLRKAVIVQNKIVDTNMLTGGVECR